MARPTTPRPGTGPRLRRSVAVLTARGATSAARLAGHRGTALPGVIAERAWPTVLPDLARQLGRVVVVVGTNGKTTSSRLLARVVERLDREPLANRSGANMRQGVVAALVGGADARGRLRTPGVPGVFEVDELALETLLPGLVAPVVLATNLFRDQLDRYGEADAIVDRWAAALRAAPAGTTLVHCADDPRLTMLAAGVAIPTLTFGLAGPPRERSELVGDQSTVADPVACRTCGRPLEYRWRSVGHLGDFACPEGHVRRAEPTVTVQVTAGEPETAGEGVAAGEPERRLELSGPFGSCSAPAPLRGLPNAYNVAGVVAAAGALGLDGCAALDAMAGTGAAFGRLEELQLDGRRVVLALVKNAVSLAEMAALAEEIGPDAVLLGLNDAPADGRDVSWIWDAPLGTLVVGRPVGLTGGRATDLRLRLKYDPAWSGDGAGPEIVTLDERHEPAFDRMLAATPSGGTLMVVTTYTVLMHLRAALVRRGHAAPVPR